MSKIHAFSAALAISVAAMSTVAAQDKAIQKLASSMPDWQNPEVFRINKQPARAFYFSYPNREDAKNRVEYDASNHLLLNGEWNFRWVDHPSKQIDNFYAVDLDDSQWDKFQVPANWEINGYGIPFYHSHACFDNNLVPPQLPVAYNPVGTYRKTVSLPSDWNGQQIFAHFGAVKSAFYLYVNGKKVGYSQDSKTGAEFDITEYVKQGENLIAAEVYRYSDGSYLECQDMWRISGIERDVYLYATPKLHIADYHAYTTLTNDYRDGVLELAIDIENNGKAGSGQVEVTLLDANETLLSKSLNTSRLANDKTVALTLNEVFDNIKPWSAEQPNLYTLELALKDGDTVTQVIRKPIGFRSSELVGSNILVNGKPVLFKGVNRHEHDPVTAHVVSRESMRKDAELMKQYNINAVRLAHYPHDPYWYDLADEYGFYIMDEANTESHGIGAANQGGYDADNHIVNKPEWAAAYIDRVSNMYERSKNSASVIMRSLGNESGDGPNLEATYDWLKDKEPNSPVMSEQAQLRRHTDAYGQMYAGIDQIVRYAESGLHQRPVILIEYEHAMGNSLGNFGEYWDAFEKYDILQGGFIWDWVDQTFAKKAPNGEMFWAYGGDLEPPTVQHSDSFSANGLVYADRSIYPYLHEVKKVHQNIDFALQDSTVVVANKYFFKDLSDYNGRWRVEADGVEVASGELGQLSAAAQTSQSLVFDYQHTPKAGTEYFVTFEAYTNKPMPMLPQGHVVGVNQYALPSSPRTKLVSNQSIKLKETSTAYAISGKSFSVMFDKEKGAISQLTYGKTQVLVDNVRPDFWRAPIDNDFDIGDYTQGFGAYQNAGRSAQLTSMNVKRLSKSRVQVQLEHFLAPLQSRYLSTYIISGDGRIDADVWFYAAPHAKMAEMPRLGTLWQLDQNLHNVQWFGRGPHENYWDRDRSALVGRYSKTVDELYVPYVRPQENGYRTDVREVTFTNEQGEGVRFEGSPLLSFGAQYYDTDQYDSSKHDVKRRNMHPTDLVKRDRIFANIDFKQRGVGGTDSWGTPPLLKYRLPRLDYRYQYAITPVSTND